MKRLVSYLVDDKSIYHWEFSSDLVLGGGNGMPDDADIRKAKREGCYTTDSERSTSLYWKKVYGQKLITVYEDEKN